MPKTWTAPKLKQHVRAALSKLGTNADQVAASLGRRKIKGAPDHATRCPIARYIGSALPKGFKAGYVDGFGVEIRHPNEDFTRMTLPRAVRTFIARFDEGEYPKLVRK